MKPTIRKNQNQKKIKSKNLFHHLKNLMEIQNPNYWDEITEEDKKTWSNYMINRFLSMKSDWVELVNEFQKYNVKPKDLYKFYINVLPKRKQWLKYVKGRNDMNYPNWLINIVRNNDECSRAEAIEAIGFYMLTDGGMLELREILVKWGIEESKLKELGIDFTNLIV